MKAQKTVIITTGAYKRGLEQSKLEKLNALRLRVTNPWLEIRGLKPTMIKGHKNVD